MRSPRFVPALLFCVALFGSPVSSGGQEIPDLGTWARGHLTALEEDEATPSSSPAIRLERIRAMYFLSVEDGQWAKRAQDSLAVLEPLLPPESELEITHSAYRGALEVVRAKHARFPPNKIKHLNRGSKILDELVGRRPENLEVRYLRLASYLFLPFFLQRGDEVKEDTEVLTRHLPDRPDAFSPTLYAGVVRFVLDHAELDADARHRLENSLSNPSSADPFRNGEADREMRP